MSNNLNLNRNQLAQFLPTPEAIRAFEKLMEYVGETGPDEILEVLQIANSMRRTNQSQVSQQVNDLQLIQPRTPNLTQLIARIESLEQQIAQRQNLSALMQRIENLEKLTGV